jgi:hypothetical protein
MSRLRVEPFVGGFSMLKARLRIGLHSCHSARFQQAIWHGSAFESDVDADAFFEVAAVRLLSIFVFKML